MSDMHTKPILSGETPSVDDAKMFIRSFDQELPADPELEGR